MIFVTGIKTAARVAKLVFNAGLAGVKRPTDEEAFIRQQVYTPEYRQFA
jgi:malate dehydrogenase (oxaloacetate-decarboxylating)(NADP+)